MPEPERRDSWYWEKNTDDQGRWKHAKDTPSGQDLAALRRGLGRPAGSVPQMWPFYQAVVPDEHSPRLVAEHVALSLYGLHQQSKSTSMHRPGVGLGTALRDLSRKESVSEAAVTRRFNAAATATSTDELVAHLRGLITQLRTHTIALDYSRLWRDLLTWSFPDGPGQVRRRWGMQFHAWQSTDGDKKPSA
ncbi:type I-E CRISPR-associated protein Cse2/CasB [Umezawaea beigongshangensis]|uniref:type I-E CRISPR-associated protein Cse2/CasB n=1 Tax=Umezawaea beigongshangensis TaxID=2780383 RepID=UPI0018F1215E|nr:type I-E CRISPR-associated protein Cse2/CasB [Umezawaea beigongshangensis]